MENIFTSADADITIRLLVAILCGMIIGVERIIAHKTAGMRTYALVAMGAALFVVISEIIASVYTPGGTGFNPVQIPAAIVTGIGFLGAGLIIFKDSQITGITTATSIWVSAGIGIAAGFGMFSLALIATGLTLFIFVILWFIEQQVRKIPAAMEHRNGNHSIPTE